MALPVRVLPVKEILLMSGCSVIHFPTSSLPLTKFTTPGGKASLQQASLPEHQGVVKGV